tara:strand:- start:147 stop:794 length:648 start_codon:yes stop_codon:yes gene_type:complete
MYKASYVQFPFLLTSSDNEATKPTTLFFYENINAYVDLPSSTYWIVLKFTGRNNNYQRSCIAVPTNADFSSPVYESNSRYVKFGVQTYMPKWTGAQTVDTSGNKYIGNVVLPTKDIYDIKVYYSTSLQIDTDHADVTLIPEIKPVVYVTDENRDIVTSSASWADYLNPVFVSYNSYTTNDLTEVEMTTVGKPASASVDNRDVQYGVQTWTPNYNN